MEVTKKEISMGLSARRHKQQELKKLHIIFFAQKIHKTKYLTMAGITGLEESCSFQRPSITVVQDLQKIFFLTD